MNIIKSITSDEFQLDLSKKGKAIPVLNNPDIIKAFGQESEFKGKNLQAFFYHKKTAAPVLRTKFDGMVEKELGNVLPLVMTGEMDVNTALRTAEEAANKAMDTAKAAK